MQTVRDLDRSNARNVGQIAPNTTARVVDISTGKGASILTDVGVDEIGELWLAGPQRMLGYLNNDDANKNALTEDGTYLKTGDIVKIDSDGALTANEGILLFRTA